MKRPFRRFEVLCLAAALAGGAGCNPDHSVKPGAPVLTEVAIVEGGGATITSIPAGEAACVAGTAAGAVCDPTAASTCFLATKMNWCRCMATPMPTPPTPPPVCTDGGVAGAGGAAGVGGVGGVTGAAGAAGAAGGAAGAAGGAAGGGADAAAAGASGADAGVDAATPPAGTWDCDPFAPTAQVLFIFDRLLDTRPLDPGDAAAPPVAAAAIASGATPLSASVDYRPNGTPGQIIFPAFGDFRADGPSLLVSAVPALPAAAPVTVSLDKTRVLAKDGKTPFDGTKFGGGSLTFSTVGFSASITPPAPPAATDPCAPVVTTAPLDATGTITFNSPVDLATLMAAVTVKSGATAVPFTLSTMDNLKFTITPATTDMKWPANATIVITVPDTVADQAGDTLGTGNGQSASFTTGAQ